MGMHRKKTRCRASDLLENTDDAFSKIMIGAFNAIALGTSIMVFGQLPAASVAEKSRPLLPFHNAFNTTRVFILSLAIFVTYQTSWLHY